MKTALLALAFLSPACGGGPTADPFDAGAPDGFAGPTVSVTVSMRTAASEPIAGAPVMLHAADGSLAATAMTGGDGVVLVDVPEGGMVTTARPPVGQATEHTLMTFVGVEEGDVLVAEDSPSPLGEEIGTLVVNLPAAPAGTASTKVYTPCEDSFTGQTTAELEIRSPCHTEDDVFPVVARTADSTGNILGFATITDATLTNGSGTATLGPYDPATETFVATYTNLPDLSNNVRNDVRPGVGGRFIPFGGDGTNIDEGPPITLTSRFPAGLADEYLHSWTIDFWAPEGVSFASHVFHRQSSPPADPIDVGATLLPRVRRVLIDGADLPRPTVSWQVEGAGAPDAAVLSLMFAIPVDPTTRYVYSWTLVLPPDGSSVTLPELPPDFTPWATGEGDPLEQGRVLLIEGTHLDGYAAVRAAVFNLDRAETLWHDLPAGATLRTSESEPVY